MDTMAVRCSPWGSTMLPVGQYYGTMVAMHTMVTAQIHQRHCFSQLPCAIAHYIQTAMSTMLSFQTLHLWYLSNLSLNFYQNPSSRS